MMFDDLAKQSYLVVGTDTDVGKTYICEKLIAHFVKLNTATAGMKPVASGCTLSADGALINDDVRILTAASNVNMGVDIINPYRFMPAIAPHIAAEKVNTRIDIAVISRAFDVLKANAEVVIVEGAGGFLVPINDEETLADVAQVLNLPVILVVGMRLGCINHALLTVEAIQARGLTLAGWVANQIMPEMPMFAENLSTLRRRIAAPCLGVQYFDNACIK